MTPEALLVLAGVLLAIYTIVPRRHRLQLAFRWTWYTCLLAWLGLIVVHGLVFFDDWRALGIVGDWPLRVSSQNLAYWVAVFVSVLLYALLRLPTLSPRRIGEFRRLLEDLLGDGDVSEALHLLRSDFPRLVQIAKSRLLRDRLRANLARFSGDEPVWEKMIRELSYQREGGKHARSWSSRLRWLTRPLGRGLLRLTPTNPGWQRQSESLLGDFLLSPSLLDALAGHHPYDAIRILRADLFVLEDFPEEFFRRLLLDPRSVLYLEVKNNQNLEKRRLYSIPGTNRLLHFLFNDPRVAEKMQVWRPVGNAMLYELEKLSAAPQDDPYNLPIGSHYDHEKWHSPLFVGVRFFDIMLQAALHAGIQWHMWLYYFPLIVERIVCNRQPRDARFEPPSEWEVRYDYILHEMFSYMAGWVRSAEDQPPDQANVVLEAETTAHENGNIPKSSILALGSSLKHVLLDRGAPVAGSRELVELVLGLYFDLRESERTTGLAHVLRLVLRNGPYSSQKDVRLSKLVLSYLGGYDAIPHKLEHVRELQECLSN